MNTDFKTTNVILKLLSFQQNDNELTVPSLATWIGHSVHWNQIDSEESNFDYHQRVPTQIDRFILLKSSAFSALTLKQDAYNTRLTQ